THQQGQGMTASTSRSHRDPLSFSYLAGVAVGGTGVGAALTLFPPISLSHLAKALTRLSAVSGRTTLVCFAMSSSPGRPKFLIAFWLASGAIFISTPFTAGPG